MRKNVKPVEKQDTNAKSKDNSKATNKSKNTNLKTQDQTNLKRE